MPALAQLWKFGTVAASPANARKALESGAALLVYPGGDDEVHRPSWQRNRVDFARRRGFIWLALEQDTRSCRWSRSVDRRPPVFLTRGERLARLLGLDRVFRLKVLPISLALPWCSTSATWLAISRCGEHRDRDASADPPTSGFGPEPDIDEVYDHLIRLMQDTLDALAAERRLPLLR
jgi:hypothetical protein